MSRGTILGAISFATLAVMMVVGVSVTGISAETAPSITAVLGFLGLGITQFLNTKSTEEAKKQTDQLNKDLRNGTFERLMREAIEKVAKDESTSLNITQNEPGKEDAPQ